MSIRTVDELATVEDPAWPTLARMFDRPGVEVLPPPEWAPEVLYRLQITTRSTLGALALYTGGVLIDHGWLRLLGGGAYGLPDLATINGLGDPAAGSIAPHRLVVAFDVLGGTFAVNGGGLPARSATCTTLPRTRSSGTAWGSGWGLHGVGRERWARRVRGRPALAGLGRRPGSAPARPGAQHLSAVVVGFGERVDEAQPGPARRPRRLAPGAGERMTPFDDEGPEGRPVSASGDPVTPGSTRAAWLGMVVVYKYAGVWHDGPHDRIDDDVAPEPLAVVRRQSGARAVYDLLRSRIIDGTLAADARLTEPVLSAQLGVSRTPVREALRLLQAEALVVEQPTGGVRVAPLDVANLQRVYDVRARLEGLLARDACERVGPSTSSASPAWSTSWTACGTTRTRCCASAPSSTGRSRRWPTTAGARSCCARSAATSTATARCPRANAWGRPTTSTSTEPSPTPSRAATRTPPSGPCASTSSAVPRWPRRPSATRHPHPHLIGTRPDPTRPRAAPSRGAHPTPSGATDTTTPEAPMPTTHPCGSTAPRRTSPAPTSSRGSSPSSRPTRSR
ncbi:DUF2625 family protein [Oerskovia sp. M15]